MYNCERREYLHLKYKLHGLAINKLSPFSAEGFFPQFLNVPHHLKKVNETRPLMHSFISQFRRLGITFNCEVALDIFIWNKTHRLILPSSHKDCKFQQLS